MPGRKHDWQQILARSTLHQKLKGVFVYRGNVDGRSPRAHPRAHGQWRGNHGKPRPGRSERNQSRPRRVPHMARPHGLGLHRRGDLA